MSISPKPLSRARIGAFQMQILNYYAEHGRDLPWRHTRDPYAILVSEIMLQQTQVDRVAAKFVEFVQLFPTVNKLAAANTVDVLKVWQGLGYNRRALSLHKLAQVVVSDHAGKIPNTLEILVSLPGIGPATAASVCAYAFQKPVVFIETNIRAVYIHEFFSITDSVHDNDLRPLVESTLYTQDPWLWYNALMDYGGMLKKAHANPARRSSHHVKQSKFEGSHRQLRGKLLKLLIEKKATLQSLVLHSKRTQEEVAKALQELVKEKMVEKAGRYWKVYTALFA